MTEHDTGKVAITMTDSNARERAYASVEDVAAHFGVSIRTVRRWMSQTDIPYRQPGGPGTVVRFDLGELDEWAADRTEPAEKVG